MERKFPIHTRYFLGSEKPVLLETNGSGGTNPTQSSDEIRKTVESWNRSGRMYNNWVASRQSAKIARFLDNGTVIALDKPINPYTEDASIISAFQESAKTQPTRSAVFSYFLPFDTQVAYLQTAFATYLAKDQTPLAQEVSSISPIGWARALRRKLAHTPTYNFIMENDAWLSLVDEHFTKSGKIPSRTSRTAGPTHLHVAKLSEGQFKGETETLPMIAKEQKFLRELLQTQSAHDFLTIVSKTIQQPLPDLAITNRIKNKLRISLESGTPVGYSLTFSDISKRNLLKNSPYIAYVLYRNFKGYKKGIQQLSQGMKESLQKGNPLIPSLTQEVFDTIIAQPAFRRYMRFEKDPTTGKETFVVYISPQILSHTGPMEPAGLMLHRGPEHPKVATPKQEEIYWRRIQRRVDRLTSGRQVKKHETKRQLVFTEEEIE